MNDVVLGWLRWIVLIAQFLGLKAIKLAVEEFGLECVRCADYKDVAFKMCAPIRPRVGSVAKVSYVRGLENISFLSDVFDFFRL